MASIPDQFLRQQLLDRRDRLTTAVGSSKGAPDLFQLLEEVDAALLRLDDGTFGFCETCHDPIEGDRLMADPLLRFCLDHLTEGEQRALEQDLDLAGRIQKGLLPQTPFIASGWEVHTHYAPAGAVSGDFCDVVRDGPGDNSLSFLFGDVSGKGVPAALLMSHLSATFRSLVPFGEPVATLVERVNRLFRQSALSPHFATLVCGRLSPDGGLEICNAGHCPPILAGAACLTSIQATGMPVGTFYANRFASRTYRLAPGETLFLYTDGLSEARNASGEEFGAARIELAVTRHRAGTVEGLVGACLAEQARFLNGVARTDDLALLAVRRVG